MRIGILTSSRADFGIYLPLLKKLKADDFFTMEIIAFGTHLSTLHGQSIIEIQNEGFIVNYRINTIPESDTPLSISESMGKTIQTFSKFWSDHKFDLVFALGDRFEMFAAVSSTLPFNINLAHISGGETTLGSIDNAFRHSISLMSKFHFASTEKYKQRIVQLLGSSQHVYNTGALNIDNLYSLKLFTVDEFNEKFKIDLNKPSILITFHPETVAYEKNIENINELVLALRKCKDYQLIITMPNADTTGNIIRQKLNEFIRDNSNAKGIESFGAVGYLSCMKYCSFLLGNSSSGFVEASFFPKYVINLGERQRGRILTPNIINCKLDHNEIQEKIALVETMKPLNKISIYGEGLAAEKICHIVKLASGLN